MPLLLLLVSACAYAELPSARLTNIVPAGAARGSSVEVTIVGPDLGDVSRLYFSSPGITAKPNPPTTGPAVPQKFVVTVAGDVKPGLYDVRAIGRYGISNPRTFQIGAEPQVIGKPGNTSAKSALDLPEGSAVHAAAEANAAHFYRVALKKGQPIHIEVATRSIESRMEAVTVLTDPTGREVARSLEGEAIDAVAGMDGPYVIELHDVLYRGGADYFYRLSTLPRAAAAEAQKTAGFSLFRAPVPAAAAFLDPALCATPLDGPGPQLKYGAGAPMPAMMATENARRIEAPAIALGRFEGRGQNAWYTFAAPAGVVYWVEVVSHRLGQPVATMLLVQRLEKDDKGQLKAVDVQEAYETPAGGIPEFSTGSRDPACRVEIKQAGEYRVLVRNLFRSLSDRPASTYALEIRKEAPDFRLVAVPASPLPDPKDSKDVPISTTFLRRGAVTPVRVVAVRRDGFAGPIRLSARGLPAGVSAAEAVIPPGSTSATILLSAAADAPESAGAITISGSASIGGADVAREARAGIVSWSVYDSQNKRMDIVRSRLTAEFMVGVSGTEESPISLSPASERSFEVAEGGKLSIPLKIVRRVEAVGPMTIKLAGHPLLAGAKEVSVDAKAEAGNVELDLAQAKLPPGDYTLHVEGQAKVKYARKVADKPQVSDVNGSFYSTSFVVRVIAAAKPGK